MKKTNILFHILFLLYATTVFAQATKRDTLKSDSCFVLSYMKHRVKIRPLTINPYTEGVCLLANGVYDLRINRKYYPFARIININAKTLSIENTRYDKAQKLVRDTMTLNPTEDIVTLVLNTWSGRSPMGIENEYWYQKYSIEITKVPITGGCNIVDIKLCGDDEDCKKIIIARQYLTGNGWKPIYEENGKLYFQDDGVQVKCVLRAFGK